MTKPKEERRKTERAADAKAWPDDYREKRNKLEASGVVDILLDIFKDRAKSKPPEAKKGFLEEFFDL